MELTKQFSLNFRKARTAKGLSQAEVADKLGCATSYVSMLERGARTPSLDFIETSAKILGVPAISLLTSAKGGA
jgi:transcriptional regulator with XRE-family HTH domain